jgi:hypothetical protein
MAAQLGPQTSDVDIHGPLTGVLVAPHVRQQLRAGEDVPRMLGQEQQQVELEVCRSPMAAGK